MGRIVRILLAVSALVAAPVALAQGAPEDAFTREMAKRVEAARGRPVTVAGPLELRGKNESGEDAQFFLDRVFNFCSRNDAEACESVKQAYVEGLAESGEMPPISRDRLRLVVRDAEYCRQIGAMLAKPEHEPVMRPLTKGICAVLVADYPRTRAVVNQEALAKLKLSAAAAWLAADQRTRDENAGMLDQVALDKGAAMLSGGDYASSVLLDVEGWRKVAARTKGELLMTVAGDGFVFVVRRDMIEDLAGFRKSVAEDYAAAERGVSPLIYRWTGDGWAVLD